MRKTIQILDSTLREGEQMLGIRFSLAEKIAFVHKLKAFGVDLIEIGHPGISSEEAFICQSVCESTTNIEFLVHARACESDIIAAKKTGASWVGVWASCNDISLATKFKGKNFDWIKEQVSASIILAKQLGLKVRFTIEDASRTSVPLIEELGLLAVNAGADRLSLADTVGAWHPHTCYDVVKRISTLVSCEIEVHLHNDLGLAQANAISAIEAGASIIDASVLGIGERAGICDLFQLCVVLEKFYDQSQYHFEYAALLSQFVARCGSFFIEPHRPIIGKNVFTHVSPYHIKASMKDTNAYTFLIPEAFGRVTQVYANPTSRTDQKRYLNTLQIHKPFVKSATELRHHRDGVGKRWVLMDNRVDARTPLYMIERDFDKDYRDITEPHVDSHAHHCDSIFIFKGANEDGTGLTVSVTFGEGAYAETQIVHSPASVFIPAGVYHSYSYLNGVGRFINLVLAPNYNQSLIQDDRDHGGIKTYTAMNYADVLYNDGKNR